MLAHFSNSKIYRIGFLNEYDYTNARKIVQA
jgi:hypothetical protein